MTLNEIIKDPTDWVFRTIGEAFYSRPTGEGYYSRPVREGYIIEKEINYFKLKDPTDIL